MYTCFSKTFRILLGDEDRHIHSLSTFYLYEKSYLRREEEKRVDGEGRGDTMVLVFCII